MSAVLAGLGVVSAFGAGREACWTGLLQGASRFAPARRLAGSRFEGRPAAEAPVPGPPGSRRRAMVRLAFAEALRSAGLSDLPRGSLLVVAGQAPRLPDERDPEALEMTGPAPEEIDAGLGRCRAIHLSQACASAAIGVALAREWLLSGLAEVAVVAGACSVNLFEYASMQAVRALSPSIARPFDRDRDGITLGEGAGAAVLETGASAARRGHRPLAALLGAGCLLTGDDVVLEAAAVEDCVRRAVFDAGGAMVDYVHAHATGTPQGDAAELAALERLAAELGWRDLPVSSHKGAIGHLLHASAFPGLAAAVGFLETGLAPATAGLRNAEPTDRTRLPRDPIAVRHPRTALVNSFGFAGNHASLLLGHPPG